MTPQSAYQLYRRKRLGKLLIPNISWERGMCCLEVHLRELLENCLGIREREFWFDHFDVKPRDIHCICVYGSAVRRTLSNSFPHDLDLMVVCKQRLQIEKMILPQNIEDSTWVADDPFSGFYGGSSGSHLETVARIEAPVAVSGDVPPDHAKVLGLHIVYRAIDDFKGANQDNDELIQSVLHHGVPIIGVENFERIGAESCNNTEKAPTRFVHWIEARGELSAKLLSNRPII